MSGAAVIDKIADRLQNCDANIDKLYKSIYDIWEYLKIQEETEPEYVEAISGVYLGYCCDTLDIYKQNRIRFFCPLLHNADTPVNNLPFAMPISNFGGIDDCGGNWIPPAGSTVALLFEGGNRQSPYYIGTVWSRLNGDTVQGGFYSVPMEEYRFLYEGRRNGYLCGPNNGTQLLPPWNTESYNGFDITSINDINNTPALLQRMTFPNIYGFKTPEKHMFKMVDGDAKCNRKWKRIEIMSGCGNWMIMKDDHLHYCGQWAHPVCGAVAGDTSCIVGAPNPPPQTVLDANGNITFSNPNIAAGQILAAQGTNEFPLYPNAETLALISKEFPPGASQCPDGAEVVGGNPDYQGKETQVGANPFFKQQSECRPYKGPQTPQNNACDLPQSGIQFLSISGHSFVMDDSVEAPRGGMEWERSTKPFDFGCTDTYLGRSYWKSATGHVILMNDAERMGSYKQTRNDGNGITLQTALGNQLFMSDACAGPNCPSLATEGQGISMVSTSGHQITLSDNQNDRKIPCRKEIGANPQPEPNAKNAYVRIRSGGGMKIEMFDGTSQKETNDESYLELLAPQTTNTKTGPHIFRLQQRATQNGFVYLRAGGDYRLETFGGMSEVVGFPDDENSVGNKISQVKNNNYEVTNQTRYVQNELLVNWSKNRTLILAGQDYEQKPTEEQQKVIDQAAEDGLELPPLEKVPNVCPVLVFNANTGQIVLSDRLFASASKSAVVASIYNMSPFNNLTPDDITEIKDKLNIEDN